MVVLLFWQTIRVAAMLAAEGNPAGVFPGGGQLDTGGG
jgi:hypothetical protein